MPRRAKMPLRSPLICDEKLWRGSRKPLKAVGISSISFNIHFCLPNDIYDWRVCQVENGALHSGAGSLAAYHIALCTFFGWLPAPVYSENGSLAHEPRRFLFYFQEKPQRRPQQMAVDVSKHLDRAKRFLEKNRVEDAISAYKAVLDEAPQHQEATQAL